jgi:hypothetical protein
MKYDQETDSTQRPAAIEIAVQRTALEAVSGSIKPIDGTSIDLDEEIELAMKREIERFRRLDENQS